ncbi:transcriptional regulator, TetR family [Leptospira broomii serovar Hurstbridge str. 5399]|uniref:Transcriptional regulator, TetR family n=1 Tax=Leptospira broomii serovar Hurstbridge str. 5399 TaxID=1049789 RepID=T0FB24_9LEPT|nr:TetR/AcrR family transcriptional regulator [Leptospira broomii]EQA44777.1 transcriptional regulator, TetR family [Leptospira broomii serovar Hurstbridge str. 5399]
MKETKATLKKSRNLEITRKQILEVAFMNFFKYGFQGTSMDDLVEQTSLTKGAFYHQFPTKLALGYAVVDEVLTSLIVDRWVKPLEEYENPIIGIMELMQRHIGDAKPEILKFGCPLNNLVQEMSPVDKGFKIRLQAALKLWIDELEKFLTRAKKAGYIKKEINTNEAAHFIVMAHEGFYGLIKGVGDHQLFGILFKAMSRYFDSISR